jgi:hypothetical protein
MPIWRGVTNDWGTATNWVIDGSGNSGVPITTTDAIFDALSITPCTTGAVARNCRDLITTGFTNILTVGTSPTLGYINVYRNITLGSSAGHIAGLSYIGIFGATCALDVTVGFTVPYLAFGTASGGALTSTVTLTRSFVLTTLFKSGSAGSNAIVTAGSAMSIDVTNGSVSASATNTTTTFNANVTLRLFGTTSYGSNSNIFGNVTAQAGSTINLLGTFLHQSGTLNLSAGTVVPGTSTLSLATATISINMGSNSFYNISYTGVIVTTVTMLSTINIANNLLLSGTCNFNGAFDIIVGGNLSTSPGILANTTAGRKLTLTGTSTGVSTVGGYNSSTIQLEIDCVSNGFALTGLLSPASLNYLATNSGSFTTTGGTLNYQNNLSINMNGSTNSWSTISNTAGVRTLTLLSDVYCSTFGVTSNSDIINGVGYFIYASGSTAAMSNISGTAGLKFVGGSNATWNQTAATTNAMAKIEFAKTGGATVSIPNSFTKTLGTIKWTSGAVSHAGTLTLGATVTMDTTSVVAWNNITTTAGITTTISSFLSITGTLLLSGTTTFIGAYGFTCGNLACSVAASIITFQNINANPLAEYTVNGVLTLIGTLASRITLQAAGSSTFSGTITPVGQLNYISGVIPVIGMTVSQTTGISPVGLIGLLPTRPVITAGVSPTFTITPSATAVIGTPFSMRAGYKAKFTLTNGTGTQNVAYVTTQDIDSSSGQTITSFGSNGDDTATNTALFRTLNWGPLIAPSGSVYYTFVT